MTMSLPPFAPFPTSSLRTELVPAEWTACLDAWVALSEAYLSFSDAQLSSITAKDDSASSFLASFMRESAAGGTGMLGSSEQAKTLLKSAFLLTSRLLRCSPPPSGLAQWEVLSDLSRAYGRKRASALLGMLTKPAQSLLDTSLSSLKKFLIRNLDAGLSGNVKEVEERLQRVNPLIHASPHVASFFLAGDDFVDGLISCYKIMNPPLRKVIITTTYLCLVGLVEGQSPKYSMLTDQLYSLKNAASTHKTGPLNVNDSLVAELVTATPLLQQVEHKLEVSGTTTSRAKAVLKDLAAFRKAGGMSRPKRLVRRKIDKGKGVAPSDHAMVQQEVHIHRMSQITQIQDLFPELGSGFVSRVLDEYDDDTEQVVAHLLEGSLPSHLQDADRSEQLATAGTTSHHTSHMAPRNTPPLLPVRRTIFDNGPDADLASLSLGTSRLHIGKRNAKQTADALLADRSAAPGKAAILSALAAFDSDDDERDDTYDAADVGGAVDATNAEDVGDTAEEALYRAWQTDKALFARDAETRRAQPRKALRDQTGMTDEAVEGWGVMLQRDPGRMKRLDARYGEFKGARDQRELIGTAWRAGDDESGTGESGGETGPSARGGGRGRGRGRGGRGAGGGGGRGGGNVAGQSGDKETEAARRRKEASKGSRANHNRRDQRARKMARGGFAG